jgi:UMF1 family MFS transporter
LSNKREVFGWAMYDWASSAFSVTVATTFLNPYLTTLANASGGKVNFLGLQIEGAAFFPFAVSISVALQVLLLPIFGSIADYSNLKKKLLLTFAYIGATATMFLFLVQGDSIILGGLLFILANLSFGAALVFYNAFLPDIAPPDERDTVSSQGFAFGYLGGGLLLLLNLLLVDQMENKELAVRICLASAGVWWLGFVFLFPQRLLLQREPVKSLPPGESYMSHSLKQLLTTLRELKDKYPTTLRYLIAYLIYNDGIQTVIVVSSSFATEELGIPINTVVLIVLMIQFVAAIGAYLFNLLARRIGTKKSIMFSLIVWAGLVIYAFAFLRTDIQFWIMGAILALVLGGSQALSRSLFSQMIPKNRESEYFSFYEISERGTSWLGPAVFGLAVQLTGTQRIAIVSLIVFFIIGLVLLYTTNVRKAILEAGNQVPAVI